MFLKFDLQDFLRNQVADKTLDSPLDLLSGVSRQQADTGREFLVTNGLGSYISGGLWGENSRKYHGLFVAALKPPVERTVLLSRLDEVVTVDGLAVELATNMWRSAVAPAGYRLIKHVAIYPCPTWVYELADGFVVKQVCMVPGKQQAAIGYTWVTKSGKDAQISLAVLTNCRTFHGETRGSQQWQFQQKTTGQQVSVKAFDSAPELLLRFDRGSYRMQPDWYWGYMASRKRAWSKRFGRLLPHRLHRRDAQAGRVSHSYCQLGGQSPERVDAGLKTIEEFVKGAWRHQKQLLALAGDPTDSYQRQAVLGADQFVVHRTLPMVAASCPAIRGSTIGPRLDNQSQRAHALYWSVRCCAQRFETFGKYLSEGMLPNCFPDSGEAPAYNTSDATFWWAWAIQQYHLATGNLAFVETSCPGWKRL